MLLLLLITVFSVSVKSDSYLEAYKESHSGSATTPKVDREYSEPYPQPSGPGYYEPPKQQYGPPTNNFSPIYAPPSNPAPVYGPPANPAPVYGPPMHPVPVYGPPLQPVYGSPHGYLSFFEKLKYKLDLFTIGKILLKIVLFKKFVSFVAILCLLLFIPTLKKKVDEAVPEGGDDDDDDEDAKGFDKNKGTKRNPKLAKIYSNELKS